MIAELHETRLLLRKVSKILDFSQLQKMDIERLVQQLDGIAQMEAKDKGSFVHIRFDLVERGMSVIHGIPHARRQWEQRYKYWKSQVGPYNLFEPQSAQKAAVEQLRGRLGQPDADDNTPWQRCRYLSIYPRGAITATD